MHGMKILFCNDSYPGTFGKMPAQLASKPENSVMFLSFHPRREEMPSEVIHARLNLARHREPLPPNRDAFVFEWEKMLNLGKQALQTFTHIRDAGFVPDMIFVSFFDGPAFFLRHAFPHAIIVSSFRGFRLSSEADNVRFEAVMDMQKMMAVQSDLYFVRSEGQKKHFPSSLQSLIHIWPPYVNTEFFMPQPRKLSPFFPEAVDDGELVTVHMKVGGDASKKMIHLVIGLLTHRPQCRIALTFGSDAYRDRWMQVYRMLPEDVRRRIFPVGGLDTATYRTLLCSSTVHVFPEYTIPPLQEMLESMSCGTLLMMPVPDGDDEFFHDGSTMIALPKDDRRQVEAIGRVLDHREDFNGIRRNAREMIVEHCSEQAAVAGQMAFVMEEYRKAGK